MIKFMLDENANIHRHTKWNNVREQVESKQPVYVDVVAPTEDDIDNLRSIFHFHPTNLEDCTYFSESPKLEEHKNYIFTVVHSIVFNEQKNIYESFDVHIFLSEKYILTVHDKNLEIIHVALERILSESDKKQFSCEYVYYNILDSIVDSYFPILSFWSMRIDDIEGYVFDVKAGEDIASEIIPIQKGLLTLKRIIMPQREIIYKISHTNVNFIGEETRIYLRDVFDHIAKSYNYVEEHRDALSNIMDAQFSKTSAGLNEVMKRLTVISTIFMPLTFIVGVYGMNFRYMPELEWRYGYFLIILLMVLAGIGFIWYFKRKKWF